MSDKLNLVTLEVSSSFYKPFQIEQGSHIVIISLVDVPQGTTKVNYIQEQFCSKVWVVWYEGLRGASYSKELKPGEASFEDRTPEP